MRVYRIDSGEKFVEYAQHDFTLENLEKTLQSWLIANPDAILEDSGMLVLGAEVTTNLGTYIDLLGLDRDGDVVVVELKRDETPRTTLAQALEYAAFVASLDHEDLEHLLREQMGNEAVSLSEAHREYFSLGDEEAVSFNKEQRLVIVGHRVTPQIRQTAVYLRQKGLPVTCLEFSYFETDSKEQLLTTDIVVGREAVARTVTSSASSETTMTWQRMLASAGSAEPVLEALLALDGQEQLYLQWSAKAFSLNLDVGDARVPIFYAYVPEVWFNKTYFGLYAEVTAIRDKVHDGDQLIIGLREQLAQDPLWQPSGMNMKCLIDHAFSPEEIERVVTQVRELAAAVKQHGPAVSEDDEAPGSD